MNINQVGFLGGGGFAPFSLTDGDLRHNAGGLPYFEAPFQPPAHFIFFSPSCLSPPPLLLPLLPSPICTHQAESFSHSPGKRGCRQWKTPSRPPHTPVTTKQTHRDLHFDGIILQTRGAAMSHCGTQEHVSMLHVCEHSEVFGVRRVL